MNTKLYILLLVLCSTMNTFAQPSINAYKYVTVNERFDFLKVDRTCAETAVGPNVG